MSRLGLAGAVLAVAAAVVLALVGAAVLDVSGDARADRERAEHGAGVATADLRDRGLGTRIGESILGVADERTLLDAVEIAKAAAREGATDTERVELRGQAEAILSRLVDGDDDPSLRARAANLLGALYFEDAKEVEENPRRYLEQALAAFQNAVQLDPGNDVAKRNLELLAALPVGTTFREQASPGTESSADESEGGGF